MTLVTVLYPGTPGTDFDERYYLDRHIPLVKALWSPMGLEQVVLMRGASTPDGSRPQYRILALLSFRSHEDFGLAAAAHGAEIFADIPNFTNASPLVQINEPLG